MKEIHIECAGAGKTYGIAKKIIELIENCPFAQKIYAITYTNYAVEQIKGEIVKHLHYLPDEVVIITVHSFLLDHIIYPYSAFVNKGAKINSCSIEKLPHNKRFCAIRKKQLKNNGIIHSNSVSQYAKTIIVPKTTDKRCVKNLKAIALEYLLSDIYCLFVDEAQDMDKDFFELMQYFVASLNNFYFVGDPNQALWDSDQYCSFAISITENNGIAPVRNMVSRRVPQKVVPLCNRILLHDSQITSCCETPGEIAYVLVSELLPEELAFLSKNVFSIIKCKVNNFSTMSNNRCITNEFKELLAAKYPKYDIEALVGAVIEKIESIGLDNYLYEINVRLNPQDYARLAQQFTNKNKCDILVRSIQKIKGLEDNTVYFIICNSLLEILLGIKNDHNKETNLLYVALTRTKSRLLFVVIDDEIMRKNFQGLNIDIETAIKECGIPKAEREKWFK